MDNRQEDHLETQLKRALRRQEPPTGFPARVVTRLEQRARQEPQRWLRRPSLRWALAGALGIAIVIGDWMYRQEQRRQAEGEAARQQVILALRITGAKIQLAEARVRHLSER